MQRYHLFEFHEQDWYPASWRRIFQSGLGRALALTETLADFSGLFRRFLEKAGSNAVLDLCSGSGEAASLVWSSITGSFDSDRRPTLLLSDLYPNNGAYERLKARHGGTIDFLPEPVDAMRPPPTAPRVRTLFNSFHHFRPNQARAILDDAAANADAIAIFEATGRSWKHMTHTLLLLPLGAVFVVAFLLRPFRLENVLWGLLLPVIPFTAVFDGFVSNLRTYSAEELGAMTRSLDRPNFRWETGTLRVRRTGLDATYLFGWRTGLRPEPPAPDRAPSPP